MDKPHAPRHDGSVPRAVLFDAYGTLFDVHSVALLAGQLFPGHGAALSVLWRDKQIEYTRLVTTCDHGAHYRPFWELTRAALVYAIKSIAARDRLTLGNAEIDGKADQLMNQYRHLSAYPENHEVLRALKARGVTTGILSNGDPEMLGIAVRSLDLVSTPIVIEACHKAVDGSSLQEVYQECCSYGKYHVTEVREKGAVRPLLIITACFTGAGAALYLKEYLEKNLAGEELVEIQAMNIIDRNDFLCRVQTLSSKYNIIAVAGTVDFSIERIPFFAAAEVLEAKGILRLRRLIEQERNYQKIKLSLQQHVKDIDAGGIGVLQSSQKSTAPESPSMMVTWRGVGAAAG